MIIKLNTLKAIVLKPSRTTTDKIIFPVCPKKQKRSIITLSIITPLHIIFIA